MHPPSRSTPRIVRVLRLTRLLVHVARGAVTMAVIFPLVQRPRQQHLIRRWSQRLLGILGIRVRVHGVERFAPRTLVVANHVSWLDIWLLHSVTAVCFVAKSEIRGWPVIGWMAAKARTLFIERERRRDTHRIAGTIQAALHADEAVAVFPEGTTTDGSDVRRFHASLLQPAVDLQIPVVTVAIRYRNPDGSLNTAVAYADETTLWQSVRRVLAHPELHAEIIESGQIQVAGKSRRDIALEAERRVRGAVLSGNPLGTPSGLPTELP